MSDRILTPLQLTDLLCEEAWQGRWQPLRETNVRPLAATISLVLDQAGYAVAPKITPTTDKQRYPERETP